MLAATVLIDDHKVIGIQYLTTTVFFFFVGGLLALLVRAELARPTHSVRGRARVYPRGGRGAGGTP
jgi:heme/copper-type cytochrome/quinol oxidase subunit 1